MDSNIIISRQNKTVKRYFKILERPEKFAPHGEILEGEVIVEGPRALQTAMDSKAKIINVLVTESFTKNERFYTILDRLLDKKIPVNIIEEKLFKELSETKTPQGIMAICRVKAFSLDDFKEGFNSFSAVSDGIQDPGNMGTLIRAVDAAAVEYFISLKGSISPYNPKTIRASAGSVFNIKIILATVDTFLEFKKRYSVPLVITDPHASETIYDFAPSGREAFVFGHEAHGVREEIRNEADISLAIPIYGKAESLNVAMAGSILLYEMARKVRTLQ